MTFQRFLVFFCFITLLYYVHGEIDIFDRAAKEDCEKARTKFLSSSDRVTRNWKVQSLKSKVFEGDMIVTDNQRSRYTHKADPTAGDPLIQDKWPKNTVTYKYGSPEPDKTKVSNAMKAWSSNTCIKFVEGSKNALTIKKGDGCYAQLGYAGSKEMSVNDICDAGTVVHLLGHVIGLIHQHSRPDRDSYLFINFHNTGMENLNYVNYQDHNKCPYDYGSVMHFDSYGLSYNGESVFLGRSEGSDGFMLSSAIGSDWSKPSGSDAALVNREYGCPEKACSPAATKQSACSKAMVMRDKDTEHKVTFSSIMKDTSKMISCVWKTEVPDSVNCARAAIAVALEEDASKDENIKRTWFASGCRLFQMEVFDPATDMTHYYCAGQFARQSAKIFISKARVIYVFAKMYPADWHGFKASAIQKGFIMFFAIEDYICLGKVDGMCNID